MKKRIILSAVCICLLLCGCAEKDVLEIETGTMEIPVTDSQSENGSDIVVYICGAVKNPGVYTLGASARVTDLLDAAGGASEDADLTRINLAGKLSDGQQVVVPSSAPAGSPEEAEEASGKVNLNYAGREELMTLPGIGEAKADAILAYRDEIGWFSSTEELMNIAGIKEKMFAKIAGLIEV